MQLDPAAALAIFQELSDKGSPKGQLVSLILKNICTIFSINIQREVHKLYK